MTTKKAAPEKRAPKPPKQKPIPPLDETKAVIYGIHKAVVSRDTLGYRVKHHMTKYHQRPDGENPFANLAASGKCKLCGETV